MVAATRMVNIHLHQIDTIVYDFLKHGPHFAGCCHRCRASDGDEQPIDNVSKDG